jgi:hypothetical protein
MWIRIRCWVFHRQMVMRLPGYAGVEAQCCCMHCGLMWVENRPDLWASPWLDQSNADHKPMSY